MYKIALCDDENRLISQHEELIEAYFASLPANVEIDCYSSGESLLKQVEQQKAVYQILFLDIEMAGMNGIETARQLRKIDKAMLICYVTSYLEYTLESFEVSPFRYLLKPLDQEKLAATLAAALKEIELGHNYLFIKAGKNQLQLPQDKILLLQSELGRKIRITLAERDDISFYGKLASLKEALNPLFFVQVNQGTIINMHAIDRIHEDVITLKNGELVSISRRQKAEFRQAYNQFIKRWIGM
ncbi:LytR/AlgR family response regulator transcription factor [Enterococcus sp. AZ109]|uniref:LytR/AlgR family response regulator transcription factor n=1 Tax=Enterococcus sp. AZ109 TaxID=2774634 RepID=UPI003F231784